MTSNIHGEKISSANIIGQHFRNDLKRGPLICVRLTTLVMTPTTNPEDKQRCRKHTATFIACRVMFQYLIECMITSYAFRGLDSSENASS